MSAILGYARVSTTGQDLDSQLAALAAAGVDTDRGFTDKLSGSVKTERPGLAAMLDYVRPGDAIVVAAIDRLGRSAVEVTRTIADLGERGILLRALREESTPPTAPDEPWPRSWLPWLSSNSSWAVSVMRHRESPGEPADCPSPSHRS